MMYKDLLPIGSVVLLKGGQKRLMICGRIQAREGSSKIYDYSACYYPEGMAQESELYFFDHDAVEIVFFIGFQDREELVFRNEFLANLGELEVKGDRIVPKKGAAE